MLKKASEINLDRLTLEELAEFASETRDFKHAAQQIFGEVNIDTLDAVILLHSYAIERRMFMVYVMAGDDLQARDTGYAMHGIYERLPESVQWRHRS